ncbi:efflux RND transporter periplasmic adaptor subunit [Roseimicrobium sp. ORNL1]|nr:efflux RND transporter periplasmic adaptor subunit [Roseimicrobium sp. ORNL1]
MSTQDLQESPASSELESSRGQATAEPLTPSASAPRSVPTSTSKKTPWIAAGVAVAVIGGLTYLTAGETSTHEGSSSSAKEAAAPATPPAPRVTVSTVEERTVTETRELLGRVDARETVEVRPRVSGHIQEVKLQAGQLVKQGEVLFTIDPRWYQAQYDLAKAAVDGAKVRVRIAERDARRADDLLKSRAISVEEADTRTSKLEETRAELAAAEATLSSARLDLEYTEVRAPISGRVSRAYVTAGNLISGAPSGGTVLTTIVSDGDMYVYADVDEATLLSYSRLDREGRLRKENGRIPVEMQLSDETGYVHRGYVESSDNRVDPGTSSLVLRMVFPNPEGKLVAGLPARVRLPVSAPQPTLLITERAIGTNQSQKYVFTVDNTEKVNQRPVKLGPVINGQRVIRDGLQPGDRVIVNGLQRVTAGMVVNAESSVAMK